ncbi:MAG: hypothetical protein A2020_03285 [Lentisphaerae bacterium GWF2_45_14]|nr:MAG: hypothetical protein A2020_03285 [Lentisphaerae bacterium GWF2_45_14]
MRNKTWYQAKRFTTTELLTVMAIIAILMAMGLGVYSYASTKMAETRTRGTVKKLEVALELYKEKFGYYIPQPAYGYFLLDEVDNSTAGKKIKDTFCQFIDYEQMIKNDAEPIATGSNRYYVLDGFGGKILYRCPGYFNKDKYDLVSAGSNSAMGNLTNVNPNDFDPLTNVESGTTPTTNAKNNLGKGDDVANFQN